MTKKQFLIELRGCLEGQVNEREIKRQLHYYDNYISNEAKSGKKESQVIEELGDPRWIAKTIIASHDSVEDIYEMPEENKNSHQKVFKMKKWMIYAVLLFFIFLIFSFVFAMLRIFLSLFFPILIVLFLFWIIMLFRR